MKILVSAFEPFGGSDVNSSQQVLKEIEKNSPKNLELYFVFDVPVVFDQAYAYLQPHIKKFKPDVIVALGQAEGRPCVTVESVAYNRMHGKDNQGVFPEKQKIDPSAKSFFRSTLPVNKVVSAVNNAGEPCEVSLSPGSFVCNRLMFDLLRFESQIPSGFVHIPTTRSVSLMQLHKAVYVVLEAMLSR